jgi:signal transduction histidine kinase
MRGVWQRGISYLPALLATVAVGILLLELVATSVFSVASLQATFSPELFVFGIISSMACLLITLGTNYWALQNLPQERHSRIALWTGGSVLFYALFVGIFAALTYQGVWALLSIARWTILMGTAFGTVIGVFNARAIQSALDTEQLRRRALERRRELLSYLNALLRHEVLNSAQAIHGQASLLEARAESSPEAQGKLDTIKRNSEELEEIITDVRELIDSTRGENDLEPVNISQLLREETAKLQHRFDRTVDAELALSEGVHVNADSLVPRLFSNILNNAVEHNTGDTATLRVSLSTDAERVTVRIADDGPGIDDADRDALFTETSTNGPDHGMGLLIVDRLARRYGGQVAVAATGSDGTVFEVTLPTADAGPSTAQSFLEPVAAADD